MNRRLSGTLNIDSKRLIKPRGASQAPKVAQPDDKDASFETVISLFARRRSVQLSLCGRLVRKDFVEMR